MITRSLIAAGLLVQLVFATAVAFAQEGVMSAWDSTRAVDFGGYRIGPEDELQISVWKNEAMSQTVPVRPDGMISLPLLNDVRAAGLTPMQLRGVLINKLAEYMPNPEVSVIVKEMRSFKASVIGEVKKPTRIDIVSPTTVLDAIALAEGFNEFAFRSRIVILRREGKNMKRILFNYNKVISDSGEHPNLVLQPGDIVVVP